MTVKNLLRKLSLAIMVVAVATIANADDYIKHIAKRGETLYGIAHKYKVPYKVIEQLNPQASNGVKKGMEIRVPKDNVDVKAVTDASENVAPAPNVEPDQPSNVKETVDNTDNKAKDKVVPDVYYAKKGDTFASISKEFDLSIDTLIELNPFLDPNSLRTGTMVRLNDNAPLSASKKETPVEEQPSTGEEETKPAPLEVPITIDVEPEGLEDEIESEQPIADEDAEVEKTILVLLPFMAENETLDKQAQRYGDFYRGFLMGVQEANQPSNVKIDILTLDTNNDPERLKTQLENSLPRDVQLIIAPEDEASLKTIAQFGKENGIYVLNLFNIKDESYQNTPMLLQANISQQLMYDKAIEFFVDEYKYAIPVFLSSNNGRNEKQPFVDALKARLNANGKDFIEVNYDEMLKASDLEFISPDLSYVFVPSSGTLSEFNRFARTLNDLKSKDENGQRFMVYGYPDWTAFRTDSRDMLHNLGATIYSRFYFDNSSDDAKRLNDAYYDWYGTMITEGIPVQSILGYDAATLAIKALRSRYTLDQIFKSGTTFKGVQSTFQFGPYKDSEGMINNSLYIIKFLPLRYTDVRVI